MVGAKGASTVKIYRRDQSDGPYPFEHPYCLTVAQSNGGELVSVDKQADIMIVDHARKEAPPGSYVAEEIGTLQNPDGKAVTLILLSKNPYVTGL